MDKTYLPDLISGLEQELLRLGYTKGSMTFYRRRWNQLMAYAEDRGECYYTEQLGMDFLKEFFGITQEDFQGLCHRQKHRRSVWSVWLGISSSTMRCFGVISSIRKY